MFETTGFDWRRLKESDYGTLKEWWKWHKFPAPVKEMLPDKGTGGIMITKDGKDVCAGFVYFTNSPVAWMEYLVSSPAYRENDRKEMIHYCINTLCMLAKESGAGAIFTSVVNENLINRYKETGFLYGKTKSMEMMKILK